MKKLLLVFGLMVCGLGTARSEVGVTVTSCEPVTETILSSIGFDGTNVVVRALIPSGIERVTLESCRRLGGEGWTPKAVARLDRLTGGEVTFRLPQSADLDLLRVCALERDPLPATFFLGETAFASESISDDELSRVTSSLDSTTVSGWVSNQGTASGPNTAVRTVSESDIWKLDGDTLYFFNQSRGLQVIDVSAPDSAAVLGTLPLAAAGEQMYLLDATHVVLLTRDNCFGASASEVTVVEVSNGTPSIVATLPVEGLINESRLVGTALYLASGGYRTRTNNPAGLEWEWGTHVLSVDLSLPEHPVARTAHWVPGSQSDVVMATDRFLFVASGYYTTPEVRVFDISNPDGTTSALSVIHPAGPVADKFSMQLDGDVFSTVTRDNTTATRVETFSLSVPGNPVPLGSLKLIENERLYAARFDGPRLYAVTFRQVDPLWVVDLSNPRRPTVTGELEVPGWSTYLHPMGGQLLAVGNDGTSRTTVSLFDVTDPAHPALASRITLPGQYSHSEASYDEKALGVLPEAGMVLIPFSAWATNGSLQGVQLIDLSTNALALRGQIEQDVQARRATVHRDRVIALSGRELLSVDAADRDHPTVRGRTELAWPVTQVLLSGGHLLEFDGDGGTTNPVIRVATAVDPNRVLRRFTLTNLPFLGAAIRENHLHVLQGRAATVSWQYGGTNWLTETNPGLALLSVFDLTPLPDLSLAAQSQTATSSRFDGTASAYWPKPGLVVWKLNENPVAWYGGPYLPTTWVSFPWNAWPIRSSPGFMDDSGISVLNGPLLVSNSLWAPRIPWGYGSTIPLMAFDVSNPSEPRLASDIELNPEGTYGTKSSPRAFVTGNLLYASHSVCEPTYTTNFHVYTNRVTYIAATNITLITNWVTGHTLETNVEHVIGAAIPAVWNRPPGTNSWQWPGLPVQGVLSAGGHHGMVLDLSGVPWTWGMNSFGQLGNGRDYLPRETIGAVAGLGGIVKVASGYYHNLALKSDGTVWAWGFGGSGQLGDREPVSVSLPPLPRFGETSPVQATGLSNAVAVSAGIYHSLALDSDGSVWSWGANGYGQLGAGSSLSSTRYLPGRVSGISNVSALAAGSYHSLALKSDGTVWSWGRNAAVGASATQPSPTWVAGVTDVVQVAAGHAHNLALKSDGTVWGWGGNGEGQLAVDNQLIVPVPTPIPGLSNVISIAAGSLHSLALKSDGSVTIWGGYSALTDGRTTFSTVGGLSSVVAVSGGRDFSLALTGDGTVVAWGNGPLGNGTPGTLTCDVIRTNIQVITDPDTITNITTQIDYIYAERDEVFTNFWIATSWRRHDYLDVVDYTVPTNPVVRPPVDIPGELRGISRSGGLLYTTTSRRSPGQSWRQRLDASAFDGVQAHRVDSLVVTNLGPLPVWVNDEAVFLTREGDSTNRPPQIESWTLPDSGRFTNLATLPLNVPAVSLAGFGDLLAAQSGLRVDLFDISNPTAFRAVGSGGPGGCLSFTLDRADGSADRGLWVPLGAYGVEAIELDGALP